MEDGAEVHVPFILDLSTIDLSYNESGFTRAEVDNVEGTTGSFIEEVMEECEKAHFALEVTDQAISSWL